MSSFYDYVRKHDLLAVENPIEKIERRRVQGYAAAQPIDATTIKRSLSALDRSTPSGARDFAILAVGLETGRRASELTGLRRGDVILIDGRAVLTFRHCKGGKQMTDRLSVKASSAVIAALHAAYGPDFMGQPADAPLWVSTSPRNRGRAVSTQTIADICQRRLGISKVHALRHTFAVSMERSGAKVSDIQARLGHESLATTGRYLAALIRADNPMSDALADLFGF